MSVNFQAKGISIIHLEDFNYYPFGMQMEGLGTILSTGNDFRYNGKVLNEDYSLNWYDYGARWYDPAVGRWVSVDPLSIERNWISVYNYVQNNPSFRIDNDGNLDGDFITNRGKVIGNDGINDDNVYLITNKGNIKSIKQNDKAGKITDKAQVNVKVSTTKTELKESLNVLSRTAANGGLREEISVVEPDGTITRGKTGPLPSAGVK